MLPTSTHTRQVHEVRLSAPSQDLIWRGQRLLEDALHTASLPAAETSQLLFIRQLNVGTIHSNQSSMSLSVNLEQQIQQLSAIATPGTHPTATQAPVVSFPDDLSAYSHFAHCLCTGQSLTAWFWPRLLPTWTSALSKSATVHLLLSHLAAHPLAPFATATVLQQLHKQQSLTPFLALLQIEDGPNLLAQNGWSAPFVATTSERPSFSVAIAPFFPSVTPPWPIEDSRSLWLTAMGLIAEQPTLAQSNDLMAIAAHTLQTQTALRPNILTHPQPNNLIDNPQILQPSAIKFQIPPSYALHPESDFEVTLSSDAAAASPPADPSQGLSAVVGPWPSRRVAQTHRPPTLSGTHTDYAGLMYLLNLLQYLQLPAYLPQYNNPTFPQALLHYTAHRLGVADDDPILIACRSDGGKRRNDEGGLMNAHGGSMNVPAESMNVPAESMNVPAESMNVPTESMNVPTESMNVPAESINVPAESINVLGESINVPAESMKVQGLTSSFIPHPSSLILSWYSALKTWTRRHTGLTLKSLIQRPGELALTPTHLDLTFDLDQVDIRIRKAGLDLNPGWLPWFGRVVAFHYEPSRERRSGGTL